MFGIGPLELIVIGGISLVPLGCIAALVYVVVSIASQKKRPKTCPHCGASLD